jgi:GNAT superfamily N-acetyltransferase
MSRTNGAVPWRLRLAAIDDIPRLQALEVDAGRRFRALGMDEIADDDPPAADLLEAHIANESAWVAVESGGPGEPGEPARRIVGYALASMVDGEGHLDQVSVADDAGRRGIGTALVEQVSSWTRQQAGVAVTLTTFRDVAFNGPYYASLGFVALNDSECGPELAAIRDNEIDLGLDIAPRIAMRLRLDT